MSDFTTTLERIAARPRCKRPIASAIRSAFADLLSDLAETPPAQIMGDCDADDLDHLAEHMQQVMTAVEKYAAAVLEDAEYRTSGLDFDVNVTGRLADMQGDFVGAFKNAAEAMRERASDPEEYWP